MRPRHHTPSKGSVIFALVLLCFLSSAVVAQNTKGDKPANNQKSILRIPKFKSKSKGGDKANVRDISGRRRIRTKNKSSAASAVQSQSRSLPFAKKNPSSHDRAGKPTGGTQPRIRSSTAQAARNNVYSNRGPYVNNPSRKPRDYQRAYSNRSALARAASLSTKRKPPGRKKRIVARTASRSFVTRGRKNVYWGKFSKGERPITTDITGRTLRAKNFHTPGLGVLPAQDVYRGKKKSGDRPYKRTFTSSYATAGKRSERAWRGDVSGHAIRSRPPKVSQQAGSTRYSRRPSVSAKLQRNGRLQGSGFSSRSRSGRILKALPARAPGIGANMGNFRGNIPEGRKTFGQDGLGFAGNFKSRRPLKGGGSASRGFNNGGQPIDVRAPGMGANMGNFRGNIRNQKKGFSQEGLGFAGNFKSRRPLKGGGSISGRGFNNGGQPIDVRAPGRGANMGNFRGNIRNQKKGFSQEGLGFAGNFKSRRPLKGGGSVTGPWNNGGQAIDVRGAAPGAGRVGTYTGFFKRYEIAPGYGYQGETYKGFIKGRRPEKGGGSVSGKLWNNSNHAIQGKSFFPASLKIGTYAGNIKAKRPEKGGGSVSGKLWNNNEQPILVRTPLSADAIEANYSGRMRLPFFRKKYVRNPNADKESLKKVRPDKSTYAVAGLQIKTKAKDYEKNKLTAKGALKGGPAGKNSVKASEYSGHLKMLWAYKHNPSSNDEAMKTIRAKATFGKGNEFVGRQYMKKYVHTPHGNKNALKVISLARAVARMKDYQGNMKMNKPHGKNLHPDAQFAHGYRDNVKQERTLLMNIKLRWAKLFKKNATQPEAVKEKIRRPRYDKKEKELWKDLYD